MSHAFVIPDDFPDVRSAGLGWIYLAQGTDLDALEEKCLQRESENPSI